MDISHDLVNYVTKTDYKELSREVIEPTKKIVLDTSAAIFAGAKAPGCMEVADLLKNWGCKQQSSVLVWGGGRFQAFRPPLSIA